MGLDNGIYIKRNKYSENIAALKKYEEDWDKEHFYDFEICYWRKCWNVRSDILNILSSPYNGEGGRIEILKDELYDILKLLKSYNFQTWNNNDSIWSWEEHKKINKQHIKNIKKLIQLKEKLPDLEMYFLDSY